MDKTVSYIDDCGCLSPEMEQFDPEQAIRLLNSMVPKRLVPFVIL